MKRLERSETSSGDGTSLTEFANNEQSSADNNDAEIAEIVDVISNDPSLLPNEIAGAYESIPLLPLKSERKAKLAKRPKLDGVLPRINYNLISDRLVGTLHMPLQTPKMGKDKKDTRSICGICGAKTTIKCSHCGVGICIVDRDGRNCWREFHTRQVLEFKQPSKAEKKDRVRGNHPTFTDSSLIPNNIHQEVQQHTSSSSSNATGQSSGMVWPKYVVLSRNFRTKD